MGRKKIIPTERHGEVVDLYKSGKTMEQVGVTFGVSVSTICHLLKSLGVSAKGARAKFGIGKPGNYRRAVLPPDYEVMARKYKGGESLASIGLDYGITRERVRQILASLGVTKMDGGRAVREFKRTSDRVDARREKNERQERRIRDTWGMSLSDYKAHVAAHGSCSDRSSPMHKYQQHRSNAAHRGIAWNFTFAQWWQVWQESGKWSQRGRGLGYVMARYGDGDVPYSPETVYICTQSQNSKDSFIVSPAADRFAKSLKARQLNRQVAFKGWTFHKRSKKNPYMAQFGNKYLGLFPTPELARAAYLAAFEQQKAAQEQKTEA